MEPILLVFIILASICAIIVMLEYFILVKEKKWLLAFLGSGIDTELKKDFKISRVCLLISIILSAILTIVWFVYFINYDPTVLGSSLSTGTTIGCFGFTAASSQYHRNASRNYRKSLKQ